MSLAELTDRAKQFLADHDAATLDHPGGTLLTHLVRTSEQLAAWGASDDLVLAGLCHATYGTDGFAHALIPWTERPVLVDLIGPDAEALVYFYASCDRTQFYPLLGHELPLTFRDRFTNDDLSPSMEQLRPFMELTFANELDIVRESPDLASAYGPMLRQVFDRCHDYVTPVAWDHFESLLPVP